MDVLKYRTFVAQMEEDLQEAIAAETTAAVNLETARREYSVIVKRREVLLEAVRQVRDILPIEKTLLNPVLA